MNKITKLVMGLALTITLSACGSNSVSDNALVSMGNHEVGSDEIFNQARMDSQGQGYFNLIDSKLLEQDFNYENNDAVKSSVDSQIEQALVNNPDLFTQFDVERGDNLALAQKTGVLLSAQRQAYIRDYFDNHIVTEQTLRDLYDQRSGELISYNQIALSPGMFDNDATRLQEAVDHVQNALNEANADTIASTFQSLVNEYPGDGNNFNNGLQDNVSADGVDSAILERLDSMSVGEFTVEPIEIGGTFYFIYKSHDDVRQSFEARRDALLDTAYSNATGENQFLADWILYQLRERANVSFADPTSEKIYNQAMANIRRNYENRVASLQEENE